MIPGGHPYGPGIYGAPQQPAMAVPTAGPGATYGGPATAPMTPPAGGGYVAPGDPTPPDQRGPRRPKGRTTLGQLRGRRGGQPLPWWVRSIATPTVIGTAAFLLGHRWMTTIAAGALLLGIVHRTHLRFPPQRRTRPLLVGALSVALMTVGVAESPPWANTVQPAIAALPRAAKAAWDIRRASAVGAAGGEVGPTTTTRRKRPPKTTVER